jgi:para-aminobenzoate synthetase/4-amino-4-deoxychorismate lyase
MGACTLILHDAEIGQWLLFTDPVAVVAANTTSEVLPVLEQVSRRVDAEHLTAAGFVSYEAASGFDPALPARAGASRPLVLFGLFDGVIRLDDFPMAATTSRQRRQSLWRYCGERVDYASAFARVKAEIAAGNVYQINHTVRLAASDWPDPEMVTSAPYGAWVDTDEFAIASASPELFFHLDGERLVCKPMKGTAPRGLDSAGDARSRERLATSAKDRAENLMITDMVRNDMGRIADRGSVVVEDLFAVEQFPTVWQMTSTVAATTSAELSNIFAALFPAASITGAPKRASMQLINELEVMPRGIYTGTIGYIAPNRRCQFNVAIRTVCYDKRNKSATYGVGGGIVWDSTEDGEWQEIQTKTLVVRRAAGSNFIGPLLETMRWEPSGGLCFESLHLDRIMGSAGYFAVRVERKALIDALSAELARLAPVTHRVRLLLSMDGSIEIDATPFDASGPTVQKVALAERPVHAEDVRLYHKSAERGLYTAAARSVPDGVEALLYNDRGEVTESVIANLVYRIDGEWFTPPVGCGLLPGTLRQDLLNRCVVTERRLPIDELDHVDELALVNALRGWRAAELVDSSSRPIRKHVSKGVRVTSP